MDLGLKGRVAVVAASSQGLGKACALELAREGAQVVLCARDSARLTAAADEIRAATGAEALPVVTDLTDAAQIQHLAEETLRRYAQRPQRVAFAIRQALDHEPLCLRHTAALPLRLGATSLSFHRHC